MLYETRKRSRSPCAVSNCGSRFAVPRGLGAAGIGIAKIETKGEIYGLERLRDFPGAYIQAPQTGTEKGLSYRFILGNAGLWLKNANGVIMHLQDASRQGAIMGLAGDAVVIKMNQ
jgi:hypothetical protein